ncbi:D-alanyl-D-alanine carboxypeptidase family protein [Periweissella fabalis]|uniref:D-alanyl-D-alanine carboxypeptidase n=1 Tax=Periweissella fabalis TaxID=1070421 RepID=A0A7X6S3D8_9LACO|nr:D-alanyl-D-alanine carboxypeptidase family protein [Periweissella fabalis]MCM0599562.1 D-alanyl-D-alanine carboxypeptidase [Periweissella fabalis]NKZ23867.1 D-alanyl-D-alanine carboxypeptidase [Periweissella fabalis]
MKMIHKDMQPQRIKLLLASLLIMTGLAVVLDQPIIHADPVTTNIDAKGAIVVDAESGQIIAQQNMNKVLPAASTSKLITAYLVNKAISKDNLFDWDSVTKISKNVAKVSIEPELTNVPLAPGRVYSVQKLYQAALLGSANAAAMALGDAISGNQHAYIQQMKQQLGMWGIDNATINSAAGLLNSQVYSDAVGSNPNTENLLSPKDMAIIATHLVDDYPNVIQTTALPNIDFYGTNVASTDALLPGGSVKTKYQFDGLKTGTSIKAHQNFVGTLKYDNRRLITVVFGTGPVDGENPTRFYQTIKLLDQTLSKVHFVKLDAGAITAQTPIKDGQDKTLIVTNQQPIGVWLPRTQQTPKVTITANKEFAAPVKKGEAAGMVKINDATYLSSHDDFASVAVAQHPVKKLGFFAQIWRNFLDLF